MRSQEERRQCRRQRQRDEGGDDRRGCDGERKLPIERARNAGDESAGNENGAKYERDGDKRAADLVHGLVRGFARAQALPEISFDILHHHDGVVDDDADGEHEAEQGEIVQRKAEGGHHEERAYEGHRDGNHGNDGGPPGLQEQDDDEHDQRDRLEQRPDDLVDRLLNELRRVVDDTVFEAGREAPRQVLHRSQHGRGGREGVRARPLIYQKGGGDFAVEICVRGVDVRPELYARDVAHPRHPAIRIGSDDDVAELIRTRQPAECLNRHLEAARRCCRRLIDGAGRDLNIGGAQSRDDVAGSKATRLDLGRVEPHSHGIVAGAQDDGIAHPVHPREDVFDVDGRVVRNVLLVQRSVWRDQMDDKHQVG